MPHSSGGGSYNSGSCSGGSYSSGGGSHSSGPREEKDYRDHSGSKISKRNKISRNNFIGASKYVYYENNRPQYFYSNYDIKIQRESYRLKERFWVFIGILPLILIGILLLLTTIKPTPKKLTIDTYSIVINDSLNVLENKPKLNQTLQEFYNKTGIAPAVITVSNYDWGGKNLEEYAFELYVDNFKDENHWLIVYSQNDLNFITFISQNGENEKKSRESLRWYWEGMQGDNTDSILTQKKLDTFNKTLQNCLQNSSYTVDEAIEKAFREIIPTIMEKDKIEKSDIMFAIIWNSIMLIIVILIFVVGIKGNGHISRKIREKSVLCNVNEEIKCNYCGGIYVKDTCISCPHCGAPIIKKE